MLGYGNERATRKPILLFRLFGLFLLRLAERKFLGLLFQEPPRRTRLSRSRSGFRFMAGSNQPPLKIAWRKRQVSACSACAIHANTRCSTSFRSTVPARQRARNPRNRLRNRSMFLSGKRLPVLESSKPRKAAGTSGLGSTGR